MLQVIAPFSVVMLAAIILLLTRRNSKTRHTYNDVEEQFETEEIQVVGTAENNESNLIYPNEELLDPLYSQDNNLNHLLEMEAERLSTLAEDDKRR